MYQFESSFPQVAPAPRLKAPGARRLLDLLQITDAIVPAPARRKLPLDPPAPGQVMLITGASGSGKSLLLSKLRPNRSVRVINLADVELPGMAVIDLFDRLDDRQTLSHLARFGLAEAWTAMRLPSQLSVGQRWRLRMALAVHQACRVHPQARSKPRSMLVCDEFAAMLDRVTAQLMAHRLRACVDQHSQSLAAVIATSHDDLLEAARPDVLVRCDFGVVRVHQRHDDDAQSRKPMSRSRSAARPQTQQA